MQAGGGATVSWPQISQGCRQPGHGLSTGERPAGELSEQGVHTPATPQHPRRSQLKIHLVQADLESRTSGLQGRGLDARWGQGRQAPWEDQAPCTPDECSLPSWPVFRFIHTSSIHPQAPAEGLCRLDLGRHTFMKVLVGLHSGSSAWPRTPGLGRAPSLRLVTWQWGKKAGMRLTPREGQRGMEPSRTSGLGWLNACIRGWTDPDTDRWLSTGCGRTVMKGGGRVESPRPVDGHTVIHGMPPSWRSKGYSWEQRPVHCSRVCCGGRGPLSLQSPEGRGWEEKPHRGAVGTMGRSCDLGRLHRGSDPWTGFLGTELPSQSKTKSPLPAPGSEWTHIQPPLCSGWGSPSWGLLPLRGRWASPTTPTAFRVTGTLRPARAWAVHSLHPPRAMVSGDTWDTGLAPHSKAQLLPPPRLRNTAGAASTQHPLRARLCTDRGGWPTSGPLHCLSLCLGVMPCLCTREIPEDPGATPDAPPNLLSPIPWTGAPNVPTPTAHLTFLDPPSKPAGWEG
ncbi:hypothetical protein Cadr_000006471 [Camelus dromedarius]|uniref:Uncharacterized protein n=1 Tax=Camelus dromedarius TaxID=9838 RepID=A0A5N4E1X5_CAMDR|nr:hypothetical protein Cadr_000006471 [Camelus dromedarius]